MDKKRKHLVVFGLLGIGFEVNESTDEVGQMGIGPQTTGTAQFFHRILVVLKLVVADAN